MSFNLKDKSERTERHHQMLGCMIREFASKNQGWVENLFAVGPKMPQDE